jgi:heat shock protein HslJ
LPHSFSRPIGLLGVVAVLTVASNLGRTEVAAFGTVRGEIYGPPAVGWVTGTQDPSNAYGNLPVLGVQPSELTDANWRLDSYSSGGFLTPVLDDTVITLTFERDGTVHGHASCNDYFGPYRASEFTISIGPIAATRMACQQDVMEQEHAYLDALERAASFTVQATTLTLAEAGGLPLAIFGWGLLSTSAPFSQKL